MGVRLELYWFSINVSTLIILTLVLTETCCDSKKGKTPSKCHQEMAWNDTSKDCSGCKPGYYGNNCSQSCKYPHFGDGCQQKCNCLEKECDFSIGCSNKATTMYVITSVLMSAMDNKTVEMDNKTGKMDKTTDEINKPKEILFQDTLGTMFNTNNMSIMVVSGASLILVTLMIVFAYRLIRKKYSERRKLNCHNKEKLPDDSMQEPVHYEEILNIAVLSTVEESFHQSDID